MCDYCLSVIRLVILAVYICVRACMRVGGGVCVWIFLRLFVERERVCVYVCVVWCVCYVCVVCVLCVRARACFLCERHRDRESVYACAHAIDMLTDNSIICGVV